MNTKALSTCVLAALAATASAQDPVYSVNIVGIQKVAVTNTFTQISNPFIKTAQDINSVVGDQLTGGTDFESGDNLLFWDGTKYNRYFLVDAEGHELDGKWVDDDLNVSTEQFTGGKGAWVVLASGATNTVSLVGDVVTDATRTVAVNPGFNLISYPYSAPVELNSQEVNLNKATGCAGGEDFESSDVIYMWGGSNYKRFFLVDAPGHELDNKWVDDDLVPTTININPGQGFWYYRKAGTGAFNWVTSVPY